MQEQTELSMPKPKPTGLVPIQPEGEGGAQLLSDRAQLVKRASQRIPATAENLIVGFYRADLLPASQNENKTENDADQQLEEAQALRVAYVELSYEQGYPTLPSGEPFWHKLDYEPGLAYGAFQVFLDLGDEGARELSELARNEEFLGIYGASQGRPVTHAEALQVLSEYHTLYYWRQRARAHDLFKEAAYRHIRIRRQMNAEDYHYKISAVLLKKVETYLNAEDFTAGLTPKVAIEALKALVAIQRVSVGLPAGGPLPTKDNPEVTQFEAILRRLGVSQAASDTPGAPRERSKLLDDILSDPKTARQMQELVIRVTTTSFQDATEQQGRTFDSEDSGAELAEDIQFHKGI